MNIEIDRCAFCSEPLPARAATGRTRLYCDDVCKVAAYRDRRRRFEAMPADAIAPPHGPVEEYLAGGSGSVDQQVAAALLEAQALSFTFRRLGREARKAFSWRCIEVAKALDAALDQHFKEALK